VLDTAGNISWSDEAFRIWGQKAGEFIPNAESFIPLIHPDDRAAMQTWNEQCFAGNKPSELEFRVVLPHEVRILIGRGELKQDANGQSYLAGTVQDVTERKLVERKVQESEERLNLSQEYGGIGSWEADMITGKQIWSRTVYQLLGFPALSNPTWEDFLSVVYPDDRQTVIDAGLAHLNHRAKYDVEYRATLTDGKIHWLRSAGQAQFAADDTAIKFMGIVQDITERKQTEIDLRIAATVFEAQEGMLITDANCIILKINHAFTLITGYSTTESIGQTPHFLQSGRHNKAFYDTLWQTIHDTGAWQGEIWDRRKNNEIYPQWLTITAVKDKNGAVVSHYVATLTDITARKANEETINRLAFYDPLTHLPNRRLLQERLKHGIEISHRTGSLMAVMMMDLDRFKAVNDSLGHAAGDALLQQVAERIKNRLREIDMVARLGGDEFVIVIDEVLRQDVDLIAKAIIQALSQPFTLYETHQVSIGVSIGIAFYPQHGDSADALMDNADTALYVAKDQGRGCFAYFSNSSKKPPSV
jgi:diguanylate cyclase (GGDEF)-like protein/PAS domain S-box-containing protein